MLPVEAGALQAGRKEGLASANISSCPPPQCLERLQATQPMVSELRYLVSEAHTRTGGHVSQQLVVASAGWPRLQWKPWKPWNSWTPGVAGSEGRASE